MKIDKKLLAIDLFVLLAFSAGGVKFHHVGGSVVLQVFRIIWPFAVGFAISGLILKAYLRPPTRAVFLVRSLFHWLAGMGLGFLLRGVTMGVAPSFLFVKIAMAFTGVTLAIGRGLAGAGYSAQAKDPDPL